MNCCIWAFLVFVILLPEVFCHWMCDIAGISCSVEEGTEMCSKVYSSSYMRVSAASDVSQSRNKMACTMKCSQKGCYCALFIEGTFINEIKVLMIVCMRNNVCFYLLRVNIYQHIIRSNSDRRCLNFVDKFISEKRLVFNNARQLQPVFRFFFSDEGKCVLVFPETYIFAKGVLFFTLGINRAVNKTIHCSTVLLPQ